MATITKKTNAKGEPRYRVRWRERQVLVDKGGARVEKWLWKEKTVKTMGAAKSLKSQVEFANDVGTRWVDEQTEAVSEVATVVDAYLDRGGNASTVRHKRSLLNKFLSWPGSPKTLDGMSSGVLLAYSAWLRGEVKSVHRYVLTVEQLWRWAHKHRDTYPGAPEPVSLTSGDDREIEPAPAPRITRNPTWEDVDRMIHALTPEGATVTGSGTGYRPQWETYRRIALVQRYTGLRISQVCGLGWEDLDLEAGSMWIRSGSKGSKGQRRDRMVPLHPALVELFQQWEPKTSGRVFSRTATKGPRRGQEIEIRGDDTLGPLVGAWKRAGIDEDKWAAVGREKGRPTHAIRATWKSTITAADGYELATLMAGQAAKHSDHDAYVTAGASSPYWSRMVAALEAIPRHVANPPPQGV